MTDEYSEDVEGATRRLHHQTVVEAAGLPAARAEVTTRGLPS